MKPEIKTEIAILTALFKATIEQSNFLTGELKQKPKQDFNIWKNQGEKLLLEIEKRNESQAELIEAFTDVFHNIIFEIKEKYKLNK